MYLHQRGVKGFVTVNVLIFDEELATVEEHVRHIAACGVDAVIVQACCSLSCWVSHRFHISWSMHTLHVYHEGSTLKRLCSQPLIEQQVSASTMVALLCSHVFQHASIAQPTAISTHTALACVAKQVRHQY